MIDSTKSKQLNKCNCEYRRLLFMSFYASDSWSIELLDDDYDIRYSPDNHFILQIKCKGCRQLKNFLIKVRKNI